MKPEYLYELADLADPDKLWRIGGIRQLDLPPDKKKQLDTGIALRRYAAHLERCNTALAEKKSVLITPLSPNGTAVKLIDTPADHAWVHRERK